MAGDAPIVLSKGPVEARVDALEGGAVNDLLVDGRPVLARTPWADEVRPGAPPAATETAWVARWRGGWQLCFPSTGQPEPGAAIPQGFHGVASQASWEVLDVAVDRSRLRWTDDLGLSAERDWRLTDQGIEAETRAVNGGRSPRSIAIAEHLILGGDILAPLSAGGTLTLDVPAGSMLGPLDYAGRPAGPMVAWPGDAAAHWTTVTRATPPRVAAIVGDDEGRQAQRRVIARGLHVDATITWSGLPHALLWEELGASRDAPWNGSVVALGIEPTSTPHGAGTAAGAGIVTLAPGDRMTWRTELAVRWVAA